MSDVDPKISVVITCFNYARYVAQAIDSALTQIWPHTEIIVVDDGLTDGSADIIAGCGDKINFIRQQNAGQAAAGYAGFNASSGDIVLFLDADDILMPLAAAEIARVWRPTCVKVQYDLSIINAAGEKLGRQSCNFLPDYNAEKVRQEFKRFGIYQSPVMSGNAYSRWYLEQLLPLTTTRVLDGILNTVAPVYGDILTISMPLAYYRLHDSNYDNQGAGAASDPQRFAKNIRRRHDEVAALREHVARKNVTLPPGNLLDHDLLFINYRLMLKKIGYDYVGAEADASFGLWKKATDVLRVRPMPMKNKLAHAVWFTMLVLAPRMLAEMLVTLRFDRAAYIQPVRKFFGRTQT